MTKKLESLFNIESDEIDADVVDTAIATLPQTFVSTETLNTIDKIESALPAVKDLEASDSEMDEMASLAKDAFNNLMDLGMQVDSRFSAEIFNSASSMLGHAITAKTAKINKKLKMIDLQLKKAELERKLDNAKKDELPASTEGTGKVVDRNELIKSFLAEAAKKTQKDK
jgi:hypothetical protein